MPETLSSLIRPERGPVLPTFERLAPPPPLNLVAAEIEARSRPGDVIVDLFGRGAWVARTAIGRLRRSYTFESTALTRLLAEVVLRPPDIRHFDAAVASLASSPRGEASLRQSLNDLFASRCATCGRSTIVDEFIWDGDATAPFRKSYRCVTCRDQVGGGEQRTAPTDDADAARASATESRGPAWQALLARYPSGGGPGGLPEQLLSLYTPRTLTALHAIIQRLDSDLRAAPIEAALRLALLHVLLPASRLNSYPGRVASLRVAGGRVRMPGDRQWRERNPWLLFEDGCRLVRGFIQRLGALPGGPIQARLGDDLLDLADATANVVLRRGQPMSRDGESVRERPDNGDPRVRLVLTQPPLRPTGDALAFAYHATSLLLGSEAAGSLPAEALLGPAPRVGWGWESSVLERALATVEPFLAGDARAVIMLEPGGPESLIAGALGGVGAGYRLTSALLAEADDQVGGTLEFLRPGATLQPDGRMRGAPPSTIPVAHLHDGAGFQLSAVEREIAEIAVAILQARGEPARFERLLGEILVGLDRAGQLRRLVGTRTYGETAARAERGAAAAGLLSEAPPQRRDRGHFEAAIDGSGRIAPAPEGTPAAAGAATTTDATTEGAPAPARDGVRRRQAQAAPADSPASGRGSDQVGMLLELIEGELTREGHPRLVELEPGRWWLRDRHDLEGAGVPLSDRLEWAVFSLLSTSGGLSETAFYDRIASMFRGSDLPDQSLVRACLESYRSRASTADLLVTSDELQARYREHSELVGQLVEYGHRLGLRCWVNRKEQKRVYQGRHLSALLTDSEQRAYLPLVSRGSLEALEAVDCLWYLRGKATILFEVEWTAMLAEPVLRRGRAIPQDETTVRFLVVLPERVELIRYKLARSPLLRAALEEGNWHILKANHLRTIASREGADLGRFEPFLGLDPDIERQGEQLPLFDAARNA